MSRSLALVGQILKTSDNLAVPLGKTIVAGEIVAADLACPTVRLIRLLQVSLSDSAFCREEL